MKKFYFMFVCLATFTHFAWGESCTRGTTTLQTSLGDLISYRCQTSERNYREWRLSSGVTILRGDMVSLEESDSIRTNTGLDHLVVFSGTRYGQPQPAVCIDKLYMADFTGTKPRVFEFGFTNTCNTFHWASWGKNNSAVIAIKENVKIKYKNGKFTFPDFEDYIQHTLSATGSMVITDYKPFVRELPIPAAPLK